MNILSLQSYIVPDVTKHMEHRGSKELWDQFTEIYGLCGELSDLVLGFFRIKYNFLSILGRPALVEKQQKSIILMQYWREHANSKSFTRCFTAVDMAAKSFSFIRPSFANAEAVLARFCGLKSPMRGYAAVANAANSGASFWPVVATCPAGTTDSVRAILKCLAFTLLYFAVFANKMHLPSKSYRSKRP